MKNIKKLTKQQIKNRALLAKTMTDPMKSKEEMKRESQKFSKLIKRMYG